MSEPRKLNDMMGMDHLVLIMENGVAMDYLGNDHFAPNYTDDELDSDDWDVVSAGYTGQYSYNGPVMHNSEYVGGRLEEDILSRPGIYAAIPAQWSPEPGDDETTFEGWVVVRLKD